MNRILKTEATLRNWIVLFLLMAVPALTWGQKKSSAPAPHASAPAAHASAPAQHSAPQSHSAAPSHSATSSHTNTTAGRGSTTAGHSNTATGHSNTTAGRGTTTAGHSNTTAGHNTTTGHSNTTAGRGNTTAGKGNTTAGKGGAPAGKGGAAAGHGNTAASHTSPAHTPPGKSVSLKGGGSAHIRPNGQIRSVNKNGMQIQHGMHGGRTVVSNHNGVRVVSNGRGLGGYTQRAYLNRGGHSYYSRTYYYHGGYRAGVYRGYYYGGRPYYGYYPGYYYGPAYYGWAYNPWPAPVAYGWGWGGAPWYGYYGAYYQPYPVYPSAAFWLTDYLVAASLQAAYAAQQAAAESNEGWLLQPDASQGTLVASLLGFAPAPSAETTKLTPEVKKDLAEEVKIVLAQEQSDAGKAKSSSASAAPASKDEAPPSLDPKFKTFVVTGDLSLVADGAECGLTDGDVVVRTADAPDDDQNINVKVVASSKSDCAVGKEGPIAMDDLQEMYNHFREGLKDGMGELAKKQGTGGLPKSPDATTTAGDVPTPEPDKTAEKTLKDQAAAADQTEAEVKQEAGSSGGGK
jgi:hypothetical protein